MNNDYAQKNKKKREIPTLIIWTETQVAGRINPDEKVRA